MMNHPFLKDSAKLTSWSACGIELDLGRTRLRSGDLLELIEFASSNRLMDKFCGMCAGDIANPSENRPALHTSLRSFNPKALCYEEVAAERSRMLNFAEKLRREGIIKDVINIGIGGSEMGPHAVWEALQPLNPAINLHFLSTVDGTLLDRILSQCEPESTFVIVSSKSFTTRETIVNFENVDRWLADAGIRGLERARHIATVSAREDAAESIALPRENGFHIWPWVGGRFSVWSSIGLPLAIALGSVEFLSLLKGAEAMDLHAQTAPLDGNLPALLALSAYWDANELGIQELCLLPYDIRLNLMPAWLQQLEMESLGKHVSSTGLLLKKRTGQGVWGSNGNQGQHSFYQWLREGTWCTSIDLVKVLHQNNRHEKMHRVLNANAEAQAEALVVRDTPEYFNSLKVLALREVSAGTIGSFMAMYEHKTAMLGMLLGLNPFDQPGVEYAKKLAIKLEI